MSRFISLVTLIILVFLASLSLAGIPKLINYQGMLTNSSGDPLTGTYDINFKVYNASSGGDKRWEETQTDVAVTNGLFNVILGGATVGGMDLDFSEEYWLEIWVDGEQMTERLRFTSVGYAYRALVADSAVVAGSGGAGGGWVDDGSTVRLQTSTDKVGIGTPSPGEELEIHSTYPYVKLSGHSTSDDYQMGINNYGLAIYNSDDGRYEMVINNDGNVGIGTTSPNDDLHVANHIRVGEDPTYSTVYGELKHDGGGTGFKINANAGGGGWADMLLQTNGTTRMFIESAGKVGIGTTSPDEKLEVNGNLKVTGAYKGDIGPNNGAPFPRPAYDSGWRLINQNQVLTLNHNIGGNVDNYVVDLQFKNVGNGINQFYYGENNRWTGTINVYRGACWQELTSNQIRIHRGQDDTLAPQIRVRIWVYQ